MLSIFHMWKVKTSLERKTNFRLSRGVAVRIFDEIYMHDISAVLRATYFRFRLRLKNTFH
jgi:hypothetical protein